MISCSSSLRFSDSRSPSLLRAGLENAVAGPILDIGCGGGAMIEMAEDFSRRLVGIDISAKSVDICRFRAAASPLGHKFHLADARDFDFGHEEWAGIVAMTSLIAMRRNEIMAVLKKIREGVKMGGIVYLEVFTKKDPIFNGRKRLETDGPDYFYEQWQSNMYLFAPGELLARMREFEIIGYDEVWVTDYSPLPHRHHEARICCKKTKED